jgi:ankyrin repeat protein
MNRSGLYFLLLCSSSIMFGAAAKDDAKKNVHQEQHNLDKRLIWAVQRNELDDVKQLLTSKANVNTSYDFGTLFYAKTSAMIQLLVEHKVDINHLHTKKTALHWAVMHSEGYDVAKALIEYKADVNAADSEVKIAPLHDAE